MIKNCFDCLLNLCKEKNDKLFCFDHNKNVLNLPNLCQLTLATDTNFDYLKKLNYKTKEYLYHQDNKRLLLNLHQYDTNNLQDMYSY